MIELILLLTAVWIGSLIWKDRARERKLQEGLDKIKDVFDENPDFLADDETLDWYDWVDYSTCELCDDFIYEGEAIAIIPAEDDGMLVFCEYCLNPALKG